MADYTKLAELVDILRYHGLHVKAHLKNPCSNCPRCTDTLCEDHLIEEAADAIVELTDCLEGVTADNDNLSEQIVELNQAYIDASNEMERQMCRADGGVWISVDTRLPEEGTDVLIFQNFRPPYITIGRIVPGRYYWEWIQYPTDWHPRNPTSFNTICPGNVFVKAWMKLPEPPGVDA